jgi:hypothetical protein
MDNRGATLVDVSESLGVSISRSDNHIQAMRFANL